MRITLWLESVTGFKKDALEALASPVFIALTSINRGKSTTLLYRFTKLLFYKLSSCY